MIITNSWALFYYTQILYTASHTDCRASEPLWAAISADTDTFYKRPRRCSWLSKLHTTLRFLSLSFFSLSPQPRTKSIQKSSSSRLVSTAHQHFTIAPASSYPSLSLLLKCKRDTAEKGRRRDEGGENGRVGTEVEEFQSEIRLTLLTREGVAEEAAGEKNSWKRDCWDFLSALLHFLLVY